MAIYRGVGGSGNATDDATIAEVSQLASQAANSATSAANSATAAAGSASGASSSATSASNSASSAASSASSAASSVPLAAAEADAAEASAIAAASSASSASTSASNALSSANSAASARDAAEGYRDAAQTAETNAETAYANTLAIYGDTTDVAAAVAAASSSASAASSSASAASSSASAASSSATNAANSATAALASQNAAASSASAASTTASNITALFNDLDAVNTAVELSEGYKNDAGVSAVNAALSEDNAATSETNAANSATQAAASAAAASQIVLGVASGLPSIAPTLSLDFANTEILDPRVTFTRASTARVYDGRTVAKAEENLLLRSQEFETTWAQLRTTRSANTSAAPDGTTTADTITEDTGTGEHIILQTVSATGQVTFSVFAKAGTGSRFLVLSVSRAGSHYGAATFDLSTQSVTQTLIAGYSGGVTTAVSAATQGFHRYSITVTTDTMDSVRVGLASTSTYSNFSRGFDSYTGNGTSSLILWGAQLEQRSAVTAYTPTTTQPITNYVPVLQTAAAGVARFDHNPVTGESLGLLIEEQRTNLFTYSEQIDDAAWAKSNSSVTTNTIVAPDGALTGDKLVENTATAVHAVGQNQTAAASTAYTLSFFAKKAERTFAQATIGGGFNGVTINATFNLNTGVASVISGTATASCVAIGNDWYRCTVTGTSGASPTSAAFRAGIALDASTISYTGTTGSGIYIWGAQLEAGAFPTSYIPTVASQVTRSADSASMTGANFSSWYRADEGSFYAEFGPYGARASQTASGNFGVFGASSGTFNNGHNIFAGSGFAPVYSVRANSVDSCYLSSGLLNANSTNKVAAAYKTNDFARSLGGASPATDTTGILPQGATQANIGALASSVGPLNGTIKKIAYYPIRLTNSQLQALTAV